MHAPSILRTGLLGMRHIEFEQGVDGFYIVERAWLFGDTRRYRFVLVPDHDNPGSRKWVGRLESVNRKLINSLTGQGGWDDLQIFDEYGSDISGPFHFRIW